MKTINSWIRSFLIGAVVLCAIPAIAESNLIEGVNVSTQGGGVAVKIALREPLAAAPTSFSIANPARIAFDFPDTGSAMERSSEQYTGGGVRGINVVQSGGRTRVVLNLQYPMVYESRVDGKYLYVTLAKTASDEAEGKALKFSEPKYATTVHSIRDINFRRGSGGEGRIVVDLSDPNVGVDVRQQGHVLVVEFKKATLPINLARKFDVTDFATPVTDIVASSNGSGAKITISPKGLWEHQAYQADNQLIVEIKSVQEDPNKLTRSGSPNEYGGDKISLNIQNTPVKQLLQTLGEEFGYNVVMSDTVSGSISLRLQNVPWDQAFDLILERGGLDKRKRGTVLLVAPKDELLKKEELELQAKQQISDVEPLQTETFQLNYQRAEAFHKVLTDEKQRILSKRGSAIVDPRTNTLFIQDTPSRLEDLRKIIAKTDVPVRQVLIEARIVEATDNFSKNLGVRLGLNDISYPQSGSNRLQSRIGGSLSDMARNTEQNLSKVTYDAATQTVTKTFNYDRKTLPGATDLTNMSATGVNLPATTLKGNTPGAFSMILFNPSATRFLNLELSALEVDGKGKIVSSPRVMTSDQTEAIIEQGVEIPYQTATASGATAIAWKKANLSLKVKPQITPDGRVVMSLEVNKDVPDTTLTSNLVAIKTKHVKTDVLVENGGTVVIGGIYEETESQATSRIPVLGDLPYLGFLFRNKRTDREKIELLVFITPKIVSGELALR
jgi:type IV pilus assembly protein PilQ